MMKYGCIGEHLSHSFSKEIHMCFADYEYEIKEIPPEKLDDFMIKKDFFAINVTIPYKEAVIKHLDSLSDEAKMIGAVNTIVNKNGYLFGYNTDFLGMKALLGKIRADLKNKKVVILGTGGTSKTAYHVAKSLGANEIIKVSRTKKDGAVTYDDMYFSHTDADYIINTTPCGMFPNPFDMPVDLEKFLNLSGVIDAIYNPLNSKLISTAKKMGIPSEGGLYMLVKQASFAVEKFLEKSISKEESDNVFKKILSQKTNIVLCGMPSCGKTTIGKMISEITKREFYDSDRVIEEQYNKSIPEIIHKYGEEYFRNAEQEAIEFLSKKSGVVISTGGGAILRKENTEMLKMNGKLFFIDRELDKLEPTSDRPLTSNINDLCEKYKTRYPIYKECSDITVKNNSSIDDCVNEILRKADLL